MSGSDTFAMESLLKVGTEFQTIVTLHHRKLKAEAVLSFQNSLGGQSRPNDRVHLGVGHPTV